MNDKTYIERISNQESLEQSICFLKNGFKWSNYYYRTILKSIRNNNSYIDFYGFNLKNQNDQIIGSILTFYQGTITINNKEIIILNLSSWFVLSKERGYKAIYMMKRISDDLSNFIITNYSPNSVTEKIIKSIGFKSNKTCTRNFYLHKFLKYLFIHPKNKFILKNINYFQILPFSFLNIKIRDSKFISLNINNQELYLCLTQSHIERKIFGIHTRLSRLNVLWTSSNIFLEENLEIVLSNLFNEFKPAVVSFHCLRLKIEKEIVWRKHYYKSPLEESITLPIIGSEYGIAF